MHVPLLILFERYTHQAGLTQSTLIAPLLAPAFLIGIFVLAVALDRWYDQPVRRLMNRFKLRQPAAAKLSITDIERARLQAGLTTIEGYASAATSAANAAAPAADARASTIKRARVSGRDSSLGRDACISGARRRQLGATPTSKAD